MTLLTNQSTKQTTTLKQKMMGGALAGVLMTTLGVAAPMMALTQSATAAAVRSHSCQKTRFATAPLQQACQAQGLSRWRAQQFEVTTSRIQ